MLSDRICGRDCFEPGPMLYLADQIVEQVKGYSPSKSNRFGLLSKAARTQRAKAWKRTRRNPRRSGRKQPKETLSFERHAHALADWATEWATERQEVVAAIYFRDSDDRTSTPAGAWAD